jgi:predicted PurR-regulated permease PerM
VWVPVAIGLALTGRTDAAIGLAVVGIAVIGSIDNIVRPYLARWGKLDLPAFLIMISMFGGLAVAGAAGIILGPLVLRLAKEAVDIAHEAKHGAPPDLP